MIPADNIEQVYPKDNFEVSTFLFGDNVRNEKQLCWGYRGGGAHRMAAEGDSGQSTIHHVMLSSFLQQQPRGRLKIRSWVHLVNDIPYLKPCVVTSPVSPEAKERNEGVEKAHP